MKRFTGLALLLGLLLAVGLVVGLGAGDVLGILRRAGWGVLLVAVAHLVPLLLETLAWRSLLVGVGVRRPLPTLFWVRWVGYGANALLPFAQVGGELVRVRLLARSGVGMAEAGASIVLDMTLTMLSLLLFVGAGLVVVLLRGGTAVALQVGLGSLVLLAMLGGFVAAQRGGLLRRVAHRLHDWAGTQEGAAGADRLERAVAALYRRPHLLVRATAFRLAAWVAGAAEMWLALRILGVPASASDAFVVETVGQAARNVGFAIPGGLGVAEGGYVLAGSLAGVSAAAALALALVKRARDVLVGAPALVTWQVAEGRSLLAAPRPVDEGPPREPSPPR